jgi:hypothetical protein
MDRKVYIGAGGKMIQRRNWKVFWRYSIWVALQIGWGLACLTFILLFHPRPFWPVKTIQWTGIFALWYLQFRSVKIEGLTLTFARLSFKKWDVLQEKTKGLPVFFVYKAERTEDGYCACKCWPVWPSSRRRITLLKFQCVKLLVFMKIIK